MVKEPHCPYCVVIDDFMLMSATGDGRFVCVKCGHVAVPGDKIFQCLCSHCEAIRSFSPAKSRWWSVPRVS
jgi:hypothetical protein